MPTAREPIHWRSRNSCSPIGDAITRLDVVLALASFVAGFQNALAGGGSFLTLPALLLTGLDSRAANVTSTIALFPAQIATGLAGRRHATGTRSLRLSTLCVLSVIGGGLGAGVLLKTPADIFTALLPWLVLFTTLVFAWGNFFRRTDNIRSRLGPATAGLLQFAISVYGGYFGGGIGLLMMAALSMAGLAVRAAGATKNVLAGVINASAVALFVFSPDVHWLQAAFAAAGASLGGWLGALALQRVNEQALRVAVVAIGTALTIGLFVKAP